MPTYEEYSDKELNDLCMIKHNLILFNYEEKLDPVALLNTFTRVEEKALVLLKQTDNNKTLKVLNQDKLEDASNYLFTCFHSGYYKYIPRLLYEANLPVSLLMNKGDEDNKKSVDAFLGEFNVDENFNIVDINNRGEMLQLFRQLKSGSRNILLYPDANLDAGNNTSGENVEINFLNTNIFVKMGVSKLIKSFNLKIKPIFAYIDNEEKGVFEFIDLDLQNDGSNDVHNDIRKLWSTYEGFIKEKPSQWEGWTFDFRAKITRELNYQNNTNFIKFNEYIYTLWKKDDVCCIHNAIDNNVYNIKEDSFNLFKLIMENQVTKKDFETFVGETNYLYYLENKIIY